MWKNKLKLEGPNMARKMPIEYVDEIIMVVLTLTELQNAGQKARLRERFPRAEI